MFITVDGVDGAGKSTLLKSLSDYLTLKNRNHVITREPGGTPLAEEIRSLVLNTPTSPLTELYMFAAARAEHCTNFIIPHLLNHTWVLCDRFSASTYVYQCCEKNITKRLFDTVHHSIVELFREHGLMSVPSVTHLELVLDLDFNTSCKRLGARGVELNILDTLDSTVFNSRRANYLSYAKFNPVAVVIDASGSPEDTLEASIKALEAAVFKFENRLVCLGEYLRSETNCKHKVVA